MSYDNIRQDQITDAFLKCVRFWFKLSSVAFCESICILIWEYLWRILDILLSSKKGRFISTSVPVNKDLDFRPHGKNERGEGQNDMEKIIVFVAVAIWGHTKDLEIVALKKVVHQLKRFYIDVGSVSNFIQLVYSLQHWISNILKYLSQTLLNNFDENLFFTK